MATRFYLPESISDVYDPSITPSFDSGWDRYSSATRKWAYRTKQSTTLTESSEYETSASSTYDVLIRQYISADQLSAQTITGTVKGQIRVKASADALIYPAIIVKVVSKDGSTTRGVLFSNYTGTDTTEFATTYTNKFFPTPVTVASVDAQTGDRIVIEIGYRARNTTSSIKYGYFRFGDSAASDLPEDESTTTDLNPWVEFSQTLDWIDQAEVYQVLGQVEWNYAAQARVYNVFAQVEYEPAIVTTTSATTSRSTSRSSSRSTSRSSSRSTSRSTSRTLSSASTSKSSTRSTSRSSSATILPPTSASTSRSTSLSSSQSSSMSWSSASTSRSTSRSTSASSILTTSTITPPPRLPPFTFESRLAEDPDPTLRMVRLNGAGEDKDNPIVTGCHFRITYHKHNSSEILRNCWVTSDDLVFADLTTRCIDSDTTCYVDVTAGVDLEADAPAKLNKIHFSTTNGHLKVGIWVANVSAIAVITLDGFEAKDSSNPYIYRAE